MTRTAHRPTRAPLRGVKRVPARGADGTGNVLNCRNPATVSWSRAGLVWGASNRRARCGEGREGGNGPIPF